MDIRPAIDWRMEATTLQVEKCQVCDQWRSYKKDDVIDLANGNKWRSLSKPQPMDARPVIEWKMEAVPAEQQICDQWISYKKDGVIDLANRKKQPITRAQKKVA